MEQLMEQSLGRTAMNFSENSTISVSITSCGSSSSLTTWSMCSIRALSRWCGSAILL